MFRAGFNLPPLSFLSNAEHGQFEVGEMIIRSAFWLAIGFLVVAPHGTDFGSIASQARDEALAAGTEAAQEIVTTRTLANPTVTQLVASAVVDKLVLSSRTTSSSRPHSADFPMQDSPAAPFVFPRARPAAMG
jgi:hypothetical protein